ncbi:hypothetical protein D3C84_1009160 [compost metagenome]
MVLQKGSTVLRHRLFKKSKLLWRHPFTTGAFKTDAQPLHLGKLEVNSNPRHRQTCVTDGLSKVKSLPYECVDVTAYRITERAFEYRRGGCAIQRCNRRMSIPRGSGNDRLFRFKGTLTARFAP